MKSQVSLFTFTIHIFIYTLDLISNSHTIFVYTYLLPDYPYNFIKNGGVFRLITMWSNIIHSVTFTLSIFCDFISYVNPDAERTQLIRIRDLLFNGLALPLGIFISTGFWTLSLLHDNLMWKRSQFNYYPLWKNHQLHTIPIVIALLDNFLVDHKRRDDKHGLKLLLFVMTSYTSFALFLGYYNGSWVYPYLRNMNHIMRIGFIIIHLALPTLFYYAGGILYDLAWSKRRSGKDCITINSICRQRKKASNIIR